MPSISFRTWTSPLFTSFYGAIALAVFLGFAGPFGSFRSLAHPERYSYVELDLIERLVASNIKLQLELGSFVGVFGKRAELHARFNASWHDWASCALLVDRCQMRSC